MGYSFLSSRFIGTIAAKLHTTTIAASVLSENERIVVLNEHLRPGAVLHGCVCIQPLSYKEKSIQMWESCSMSMIYDSLV
jgi:hypothetical protein